MSVDVSVLNKIKQMGLFDPKFYSNHYPVTTRHTGDGSDEYSELLEHYLEVGWSEGFDPSEIFSTSDYICNYGKDEKVDGNPLLHYVQNGIEKKLLIHEHRELPKFSLVMPTFNRKDQINDAIQSVLNQQSDFDIEYELIITDDGSTDGTVEMLTSMYAEELSNRKIILLQLEHKGVSFARNEAVAQARFPWICYIDSDNAVLPTFLDTFFKQIIKNPYCQFMYAQRYIESEKKITEHEFCRHQLLQGNFIDMGTICHTKNLFEQTGGFDESLTRLVDWDLILRMTAIAEPIYIPTIVMNYNSKADYLRISNTVHLRQNAVAIANKNRVESLIYDSLEEMELRIRRIEAIVDSVDLSSNGFVSKYILLKYKILKSITFGELHHKYNRIYKSLKRIRMKKNRGAD